MRFSIISPSYNQVSYIRRTLRSVCAQTVRDIEHLINDGGSTDGTIEILEEYKKKYTFAKISIKSDQGQADAINQGFFASTGDILSWLNTDDFYPSSDVLEMVEQEFRVHPEIDVVYGRGLFVDINGQKIRDAFIHRYPERLRAHFVNSVGLLQPATFFRRGVIDKVGQLDTSMTCAFDYEFWVRLIRAGIRFRFLDKILAHATFHKEAKSASSRSTQLLESMEVVRRHYGFYSIEWIRRHAECKIASRNGIVDDRELTSKQKKRIDELSRRIFVLMNGSKQALASIATAPDDPAFSQTRQAIVSEGMVDLSRIIVTTFNRKYFDQGLTLIASIHRCYGRGQPIFVYDLGLETGQREKLVVHFDNVFVVDYPKDVVASYPGYLDPKNYGYKCTAIWDVRRYGMRDGLVLWIDAGVSLLKPLDKVFDIIQKTDIFFVNHDDKKNWPFFNRTFTHPEAIRRMKVTRDEMLGEHLCSCLMGYRIGGRFEHLFADAEIYSRDQQIVVWDKHPNPGVSEPGNVSCVPPNQAILKKWKADRSRYHEATDEELDAAFGYLGHRQDQSIFSILAARYNASLQSARIFCISDDESSAASKLNWQSRGFSRQIKPKTDIPAYVKDAVMYHHRGTYRNFEGLRYVMRRSEILVVLGNGPSLRELDFSRLRQFDVIGMNAAYRYWDQINWYPDYYICLDKVVGLSHKDAIINLIRNKEANRIRLFILRRNLIDLLPEELRPCSVILDFDALREASSLFAPMPITTGSHASLVGAMLGYSHMVLMGIDCNYVEKVNGAVERGGTVLELIETPKNNPNYFFDGYQVVGDRYNIPNSTSPELHLDSWRAVAPVLAERGIEVWNGSKVSRVDMFPYHDFADIEKLNTVIRKDAITASQGIAVVAEEGFIIHDRDAHACIDETQVISTLFSPSTDIELVMIDVGAHFGSSARHFVEETWRVYCFEPDPGNRQRLIAQFGRVPNVVIDARAVGAQTEKGKPLFSSPESTGISALHAFRDTHQQVGLVDVTTITEIVKEHKLDRIDFLKIDVEGHDFAVLRGVPWDLIKPAVIECEFEDAKTVPLGHTWKDIAEFLVAKGYVVYVSEWYPIIRYGIQHDWRRLFRYPGALRDPQAWGNLLAFREDPGTEAIADALRACVKVKHPQIACQTEPTQPPQPSGALAKNGEAVRVTSQAAQTHEGAVYVRNAPKETPVAHVKVGATPQHQEPASKEMTAKITPNPDSYRRHADKLTDKHTMLRPFFRFCDWSVGAIARHWLGVSGAVVMAGILLGAAFWVAPALWPYWLIVLGLFISSGVLFLCVGYGQHFFSRYAEKQAAELGQQTVGVARLQGDIARLRSEIGSVVSTLRNVCASVDKDPQLKELQERCKTLEAQISAHVDAVRIRQDALDNTIAARVDELERGLASVQAASESADRVLDDVRAQAADALETVRNSQAARDTMMAAQVEEIKRRLTASADGVLDDVRTQAAAIKALAAEAVDAVRSQDAAFRKLNASNASLARPFNRFLSTDHIRRLQQHWSKVFGVTMSPSAISYLAHRMCTAEDQCEGRIACSIETAILRQYASRSLKGDRIDVLEIGALFGLGAAFLYKFAAPGQSGIRLTLIDPLEGYYGHDVDPITGVPVDRRTLESNFEALKIPSKDWRLIQRLSTDPVAAQEAADRQYDLILIDGDHSGAGVARDYEIYGSMVKPGGLIIFDDYDSASWPSIKPFVDEHVKTDGRWIWIGAEWNTAILRRRYDEAYVRADEPEGVQ